MFFDELFQCYKLTVVERVTLTNSHLYAKLKAMQFTPQIAPLVLLTTYRLTAALTHFL